jgi:acetyl esterase/lipase
MTDLPARTIPVPSSVSAEAQQIIAMGPLREAREYPPLDDLDAWRAHIAAEDVMLRGILEQRVDHSSVSVEEREAHGVPIYVATPKDVAARDRVYFDIHGGALILGAGELCKITGKLAALRLQAKVWTVDYRMPPDHPYPTPLDDCVAAYRAVLAEHPPENVVVGGASAGGNLAAALLLRVRDEGLPMPAGAVLLTPEVDLTESGDSFSTNLGLDPLLTQRLMPANLLYAGGHDLRDPYLSPLFGDFSKGYPATMITAGTRDLFLSNAVLMHRALRAAGVPAELHIVEAAGHGGFLGMAPEDRQLDKEIRHFIRSRWSGALVPARG